MEEWTAEEIEEAINILAHDISIVITQNDMKFDCLNMAENLFKIGWRTKTYGEFKLKQPEYDNVNHPAHYTDGKIEVIDYIQDKGFNFCRGNAIKYISRAGKKDKAKEIEDLQKAVWYLNKEIERLKGEK